MSASESPTRGGCFGSVITPVLAYRSPMKNMSMSCNRNVSATAAEKSASVFSVTAAALNVIVSALGSVDLRLPVFASGKTPAIIVTTARGAKQLLKRRVPESVQIRAVRGQAANISAVHILEEVHRVVPAKRILVEGGPRLLGQFYGERLLDEQFLSLAPQLSGRQIGDARLSLVMGRTFAPHHPLWGQLTDARLGRRLLFLRYRF